MHAIIIIIIHWPIKHAHHTFVSHMSELASADKVWTQQEMALYLSLREVEMADWYVSVQLIHGILTTWAEALQVKPVDYWQFSIMEQQDDLMVPLRLYCGHWMKLKWGALTVPQITDKECLPHQSINGRLQCIQPWVLVQQSLEPMVSSSCWTHLPLLPTSITYIENMFWCVNKQSHNAHPGSRKAAYSQYCCMTYYSRNGFF